MMQDDAPIEDTAALLFVLRRTRMHAHAACHKLSWRLKSNQKERPCLAHNAYRRVIARASVAKRPTLVAVATAHRLKHVSIRANRAAFAVVKGRHCWGGRLVATGAQPQPWGHPCVSLNHSNKTPGKKRTAEQRQLSRRAAGAGPHARCTASHACTGMHSLVQTDRQDQLMRVQVTHTQSRTRLGCTHGKETCKI